MHTNFEAPSVWLRGARLAIYVFTEAELTDI